MTAEVVQAAGDLETPGAMLKAARQSLELSERETADRLNWMPGYVAIVERDDYAALRRPSFARGYVKAFGKLLALDEKRLMTAFDALNIPNAVTASASAPSRRPLQLQKTGLGVIVGLSLLCLLIAALWWWQGNVL